MYDGNYLAVSINNTKIFNVTLNSYYTGTKGAITTGSFGFGGWQDQSAYFKNVEITASNKVIYVNPMTDAATVLPEFGVRSNQQAVCLDGAKRDRLVWLGDFYHTVGVLATSTSRKDYSTGTLQNFLDWQLSTGQLPLYTALGYDNSASTNFAISTPVGSFFALQDYHILGLLAFGSHMRYNNDIAFAKNTWSQWKLATEWLIGKIASDGLVTLSITFFPDSNGLAVNAASVQALRELSQIAAAVGDQSSADAWAMTANNLSSVVQAKFWQADLGHFSATPQDTTRYSVPGLSFAVTSGIATTSQASSCMDALANLKLFPGYEDSTSTSSQGVVSISPNTNGFLLGALMHLNRTTETRYLIENLWGAMISNRSTSTGASWEYVNTELQPGLSSYTSLSHPWGGAPTYILTEFVAGIRPVTFGYKTWVIQSAYVGFGLDSASAQVQTPYGLLRVQWKITFGKLVAVINAPAGTSGTFVLNRALANSSMANTVVQVNGGLLPRTIVVDI